MGQLRNGPEAEHDRKGNRQMGDMAYVAMRSGGTGDEITIKRLSRRAPAQYI